jgi:hypothetical protein
MHKNCCPLCNGSLEFRICIQDSFKVEIGITSSNTKENSLLQILFRYWRWMSEGKLEYSKEQYQYDYIHDGIFYEKEENMYTFDIQTKDSPEGDTWWKGKFRYENGRIQILEESFH